jgi:lysophospholipid acyltransferase (LPLAT)-like uncharacterized protein
MKPLKAIVKHERVRGLLCWLAALYIRLVYRTSRWQTLGGQIPAAFWDRNEPFILSFWHGRIFMMVKCWRPGVPMVMLASRHRDGQLIAQTTKLFGIDFAAGSSSKGGSGALRIMLRALRARKNIGITPDGPRGPFMRINPGVIAAARLSGAAILPCTWAVRRRWVIVGWDRFVIPKPFNTGIFIWGEPIRVPADTNPAQAEALRLQLEAALTELTAEADSAMGLAPYEPGPAVHRAPAAGEAE